MRVVRVLAATALGIGLLAAPAQAATVTVAAKMTPDEVNPKGPKGSSGLITIDVDTDSNDMCWTIDVEGLGEQVTEVHIHDTFQGSDDPIVLQLKGLEGCLNALESTFILSNAERHDADVHTASFPNAALRGKFDYVGDAGKGSPEAAERIKGQLVKYPVGTELDFTPKEESGALVKEGETTKQAQESARADAEASAAGTGTDGEAGVAGAPEPLDTEETAATSDAEDDDSSALPILLGVIAVAAIGGVAGRKFLAGRRASA